MGSSMVIMCAWRVQLMCSSMEAMVVLLPEPVVPETNTSPSL